MSSDMASLTRPTRFLDNLAIRSKDCSSGSLSKVCDLLVQSTTSKGALKQLKHSSRWAGSLTRRWRLALGPSSGRTVGRLPATWSELG